MQYLTTILLILTTSLIMAQNGKAVTVKKTFNRETSVSIDINADKSIIWALLTNASDYSRWNSTIISIEGNIVKGEKIKLKAKIAPKRTFKIKIKELIADQTMTWGDAQGNRIFILEDAGSGTIRFSMSEKIGGLMYPLYAKHIPSFDEPFEQFASDLKNEAETIHNSNN